MVQDLKSASTHFIYFHFDHVNTVLGSYNVVR